MGDTRIPMAASSLTDLHAGVGALITMKGIKPQDAVIVRPIGGGPDQLWVRPDYPKYRDAWRTAFGAVSSGFHVDHLYSKARALDYGYAYVRLVLTDGKVNTSFGGGIEKQMLKVPTSKDPSIAPKKVPVRYADWWQLQKLNGVILGGRAKGYAATQLRLQASILGGVSKQAGTPGKSPRSSSKLKYSTVHFRARGTSTWIAQRGVKDYSFAGDVVGWLMEGLVTATNSHKESEALRKLNDRIQAMMPESGGVLVALVYQEPGNSASYQFSTQLFMYAYIVGSGSSSEKVFGEYQEQVKRYGVVSQSPYPNWVKSERYLWFTPE